MQYQYALALLTPAVAYFFSFIFLRLWNRQRQEWHILGFGTAFFTPFAAWA
ncbi:MAG: hypothetical protein AAFY73_01390 [Pseudomonadota bacterium]